MDVMGTVRPGMSVMDSSGEDIGTVTDVKLGDSDAITAEGQAVGDGGLLGFMADAFGAGEPDVPRQRAEKMLRTGYVKVDAKGWFSGDVYVSADDVDRVDGDVVHLSAERSSLVGGGAG